MEVEGVKGRGMGFGLERGGGICGEPAVGDVGPELVDVLILIFRRGGAVSRPLTDVVGGEVRRGVALGL